MFTREEGVCMCNGMVSVLRLLAWIEGMPRAYVFLLCATFPQ